MEYDEAIDEANGLVELAYSYLSSAANCCSYQDVHKVQNEALRLIDSIKKLKELEAA